MNADKVPPVRIPNGTNVEVGDWVGIVVDQSGPTVYVTLPNGIGEVARDRIEKRGRHWVVSR